MKKESITSGKIFNIAPQLTPKLAQAADAQYSSKVFDLTLREKQHATKRLRHNIQLKSLKLKFDESMDSKVNTTH